MLVTTTSYGSCINPAIREPSSNKIPILASPVKSWREGSAKPAPVGYVDTTLVAPLAVDRPSMR